MTGVQESAGALPWPRAVIENVTPCVDGGRFPIKRTLGDRVTVEADAFTDGHDRIRVRLVYWPAARPPADGDGCKNGDSGEVGAGGAGGAEAGEVEMVEIGNDRWRGEFAVDRIGRCHYDVVAWVDAFLTWRHDFARREDPADIESALQAGAALARETAARAAAPDRAALTRFAALLAGTAGDDGAAAAGATGLAERRAAALSEPLALLMRRHPDRRRAARLDRPLAVVVDPVLARFGSWYEFFPRSAAPQAERHGRFADCIGWLPRIAAMGFDIVYLPPIHPIGRMRRKGPDNTLNAGADDPGSPWAIGSAEGGHRAVHPALGTEADFRAFVREARALGLETALDIAFQCAPDHPYVSAHPDWFRRRPDGSIQYAENPPKKYQDIYPFDFETPDWRSLFDELKGVVLHWVGSGVTVFRVDNPHTKPFAFWEWLIDEVKREHPEVIFLSEAFTRPRVMHRLAKLGFSQSYTYFTWRNTRAELTAYLTELTADASREYFRPNLWPNTPDILPEYLQHGGRPGHIARLVLAATLAGNYGIYGPAFELMESVARSPGSEEYRESEKYQLRHRDLDAPGSLAGVITRINRIRRDNPALQNDRSLRFHPVDNEQILCYSKSAEDGSNLIVCVVNLDPHHVQSGWVDLPLDTLGLPADQGCQVHDLLSDQRHLWSGSRHFVQLDPDRSPAQVFRARRRVRSEHDFDYYL